MSLLGASPQRGSLPPAPSAMLGRCDSSIRLPCGFHHLSLGWLAAFPSPRPARQWHPSCILVADPEEDAEAALDDADSAFRAEVRRRGGLLLALGPVALLPRCPRVSWSKGRLPSTQQSQLRCGSRRVLDLAVPVRVNSPRFGGKPLGLVVHCHLDLLVGWLWDGVCKNLLVSPGGLVPKGDGGFGVEGGQSGCCDAAGLTASPCPVPAGEERGRSCARQWGMDPITGWPHPDAQPAVLVCTAICWSWTRVAAEGGECHRLGHR